MGPTVVDGLVFDLDNTLLDRGAAFLRVAHDLFGEYLVDTEHATRKVAVNEMVNWDRDGYASRESMLSQWIANWPQSGMDLDSLLEWYRLAMGKTLCAGSRRKRVLVGAQRPWNPLGNRHQRRFESASEV